MDDILNFYQVTDKIASSGQPTAEQFAAIHAAGYSVIINLAMSDAMNAVAEEEATVRDLGMTHIHIPVPFDKPRASHLKAFIAVMDSFQDEKVFVHCALNMRVSAFLHQYLVLTKGWDSERASSPMLNDWRPKIDPAWQAILNLTADDLT